jgi:integrase
VLVQAVIDKCDKGHSTLRKIKVLYNQMYKYAMANDIITKDYSKFVEVGENVKESTRRPFSNEETQLLWNNVDRMEFIDTLLIMIYTGLRPGELVTIETANIDLENRIMRGGIKTAAGKNRVIPINKKILPFIKARYEDGSAFQIHNNDGKAMSYYTYYDCKFKVIMEQLQLEHKPHDCRHTFATLMDNAGANKVAIKRIMGHASTDITDKVYTHKDVAELLKAIDLI